jgi:hypothetical protein
LATCARFWPSATPSMVCELWDPPSYIEVVGRGGPFQRGGSPTPARAVGALVPGSPRLPPSRSRATRSWFAAADT